MTIEGWVSACVGMTKVPYPRRYDFSFIPDGSITAGTPVVRGNRPLTAYLASENSDFIQGCVIDIDGGATRSL